MSRAEDKQALDQWSKQERTMAEQQRIQERRAQYEEETNPSRRLFHKFIALMSLLSVLAATNMAIGQVVGVFFQNDGTIQYVLRLYVLVLCFLAILVECEWTKFARESMVLHLWVTRGLFYVFIGVLGLEQNDTSGEKNEGMKGFSASLQYIKAVAWIMVLVGGAYCLMGAFCLQFYYNRLRADYEERLQRAVHVRSAAERYFDNREPV